MNAGAIALPDHGFPVAFVESLGEIAFVIGFMVVVFLAIVFQFLKVHELYGGSNSDTPDQQTNCPSCGARIAAETDTCTYCGEPIDH